MERGTILFERFTYKLDENVVEELFDYIDTIDHFDEIDIINFISMIEYEWGDIELANQLKLAFKQALVLLNESVLLYEVASDWFIDVFKHKEEYKPSDFEFYRTTEMIINKCCVKHNLDYDTLAFDEFNNKWLNNYILWMQVVVG